MQRRLYLKSLLVTCGIRRKAAFTSDAFALCLPRAMELFSTEGDSECFGEKKQKKQQRQNESERLLKYSDTASIYSPDNKVSTAHYLLRKYRKPSSRHVQKQLRIKITRRIMVHARGKMNRIHEEYNH